MKQTNHIIEKLNSLSEAYGCDIIVYLVVKNKGKSKHIIASKLLKDFNEDLEPIDYT